MNDASTQQEAIDREASAWLIRIEEDGLDPERERDFHRWLVGDPRHRRTYDAMRETWFDIAQLPGLEDLAPVPQAPARRLSARPAWQWAAGTAVATSLAAILLLVLHLISPTAPQYRTDIAETRIITLPDGSSVTLGARSSITIAYEAAERRVILSSGEALFDVVHDARRPFVVDAGASLVRDLGTKFDVNRAPGSVRVGVIEGRVQVTRTGSARTPSVTLAGGQGVQMLAANSVGSPASSTPLVVTAQGTPGAWRDGRLVFDNVRLADLSADVNRYYAPGVSLGSPAVGELRVTAAFKTSEIPAFMGALDATLPVRTDQLSNGGFLIVPARP
jgi:transmembrane sensor